MGSEDRICFEISGNDYENLKKFQEQHRLCFHGTAGDQLVYSFVPTGLGTAISVECSCGQELLLGDFLDYEAGEYDEYENRVLTDEDHKNKRFEEAALYLLHLKDPFFFGMSYDANQNFETIYAVAVSETYVVSDDRLIDCILGKYRWDEFGEKISIYEELDDTAKIMKFYEYFEDHLKIELAKYDCRNKPLLKVLGIEKEGDDSSNG